PTSTLFPYTTLFRSLAAPLTIPVIAEHWGWEMSFIIIGALGFVWMGFWVFMYKKPHEHPKVNKAELAYIMQDGDQVEPEDVVGAAPAEKKTKIGRAHV